MPSQDERLRPEDRPQGDRGLHAVPKHKSSDLETSFRELKLFRDLLDHSSDAIEVLDAQTMRYLDVNEKACIALGYSREELLSLTVFDIDPAVNSEKIAEHAKKAREAGSLMIESVHRRKDGTTFPVEVNFRLVQLEGKEYIIALARDITERKGRECRLQEYERAFESSKEMIAVISRDYRYVIANRSFLRYRGMTSEQLIGRHIKEVTGIDAIGSSEPRLAEAFCGNIVEYEMTPECPGMGERTLSIRYVPVEGPKGVDRVACILRDITDEKRAGKTLARDQAELRDTQRAGGIGTWSRILGTDAFSGSYEFYRSLGRDPEGAPPTIEEINQLLFPESRERLLQANEHMTRTGDSDQLEVQIRRRDGSTGWLLLYREPDLDSAGKVIGIHGISIDITERKVAEDALRESDQRLRLAHEVARIGTFDRNLQTGEVLWNSQLYTIHGLAKDGPPPTPEQLKELIHPEDRERFARLIAIDQDKEEVAGDFRVVWPDGTIRWISSRWRVFLDSYGRPARRVGIIYDISDHKHVEEELRQVQEKLAAENLYLEQQMRAELGFHDIIGNSKALKSVMELTTKVAGCDATVLLLGETGTGKELIARALHRLSVRSENAFIKTNCAAIPSGLLESELFGAEKGAYTGSVGRKIGRLELANKGTLFLDEIGEIALSLQPKLLRVLQDQEFERLGGTQTIRVNFRLVAATNRNLAEEVEQNQFRRDLFYRLHVFPIYIPPLRERRGDIPMLVEHFVQKCAVRLKKSITGIPKTTMELLVGWDWPGNVRELENFIERSVILTPGTTLNAPLAELQVRNAARTEAETLESAERKHILEALRLSHGRISGPSGAAARLGLKRTTLQSKLKQMQIDARIPPQA